MRIGKRIAVLLLMLFLPGKDTLLAHRTLYTNFYLNMSLEKSGLIFYLESPSFLLPPTKSLKYESALPKADAYRDQLTRYIQSICRVKMDGLMVNPVIRLLEWEKIPGAMHLIEETDLLQAYMEIEYPIKTPPQQIAIEWDYYVPEPSYGWAAVADPDQDPQQIDVEFEEYGRYNYFILSPTEPGFTWHAPSDSLETNTVSQITHADPHSSQPFPTFPVSILLVGGLTFVVTRARGTSLAVSGLIVFATAASATVAWQQHHARERIPQESEAITIFETLHQNIYRAFDYTSQSDIYDALAQSVDGPLLDRMYTDIYQSLILRDEGGAVCRVESIQVDAVDFLGSDSEQKSANYTVACKWDVLGKVKHWGHAHERRNRYAATFQLEPREHHWKICEVNVTRQERIENPMDSPPDDPQKKESVWDLQPSE